MTFYHRHYLAVLKWMNFSVINFKLIIWLVSLVPLVSQLSLCSVKSLIQSLMASSFTQISYLLWFLSFFYTFKAVRLIISNPLSLNQRTIRNKVIVKTQPKQAYLFTQCQPRYWSPLAINNPEMFLYPQKTEKLNKFSQKGEKPW